MMAENLGGGVEGAEFPLLRPGGRRALLIRLRDCPPGIGGCGLRRVGRSLHRGCRLRGCGRIRGGRRHFPGGRLGGRSLRCGRLLGRFWGRERRFCGQGLSRCDGRRRGVCGQDVVSHQDLDRPAGQRVAAPGDLLAVVPGDLHRHAVGPADASRETVVDAAHAAADLQRWQARGRRILVACQDVAPLVAVGLARRRRHRNAKRVTTVTSAAEATSSSFGEEF